MSDAYPSLPHKKKKIFIHSDSRTGSTEKCQLCMCRISLDCLPPIFMVFVIVQIFLICMEFFKKLLRCNSIHKAYNLPFWKCATQWFLIYSQFVQASSHVNFTTVSYPQKATPYPLIVTNHSHPQDTVNLLAIW